jgi:hypothetical protein
MTQLTLAYIGRDRMPDENLYMPGANWEKGDEYPPLKPDLQWDSKDYLRLAWEVMRRSPRYRWHHLRLTRSGLLDERVFKGSKFYFSQQEGKYFRVPGWEKIDLDHHYSDPVARKGQLLGEYVEVHEGEPWLVMHGTRWVLNFWGLSKMVDPKVRFGESELPDLRDLFAPSFPSVLPELGAQHRVNDGRPLPINLDLNAKEILVKLRLDQPLPAQVREARRLLQLAKDQRSDLEPGQNPKPGNPRKTDLPLVSFWLRTWDAAQEAEVQYWKQCEAAGRPLDGSEAGGRIPRKNLVAALERDRHRLPEEIRSYKILKKDGSEPSFAEELHTAIDVGRVDKWITRARGYIEEDDKFLRHVLTSSLEAR